MATYQVQTNLSVQTVQTNYGGEVGGGICKSISTTLLQIPPPTSPPLLQIPPPTSPPQLVCTVCTERLVCTRYVPVYITQQQRLVKALPALSTTACISGKSQEDTSILITQVATSSSLAVPARIQKSFPGYLSSARQG